MMSTPKILNCTEKKALEEFQRRMENFLTPAMRNDESLYYRFLKARDFDVDKAEAMLHKHLIWRKVHQIDTFLEDFKPIEFFLKFPEPSVIGYDKDGDIVRYSATGKLDATDIMKCMTKSSYMRHWMWSAENNIALLKEENTKTGRNAFQTVIIMDVDKLTFTNATSRAAIDMFIQFVNNYQDNLPERLKNLYVINAPSYSQIIFSIVKVLMSSALIRKIYIYGRSGWKEKLLEIIDANVLPAFLGGNRTDPDGNPLCKTFINHGGKIPEHYFLSDSDRYFENSYEVIKIVIPPKEKKEISLEVNNVGSILHWEFFVKSKDIGFGIFLEATENEKTEVIPIERYAMSDGKEKNYFKCRVTGKYIIVFDNSYSWKSSKELMYCIKLKPA